MPGRRNGEQLSFSGRYRLFTRAGPYCLNRFNGSGTRSSYCLVSRGIAGGTWTPTYPAPNTPRRCRHHWPGADWPGCGVATCVFEVCRSPHRGSDRWRRHCRGARIATASRISCAETWRKIHAVLPASRSRSGPTVPRMLKLQFGHHTCQIHLDRIADSLAWAKHEQSQW